MTYCNTDSMRSRSRAASFGCIVANGLRQRIIIGASMAPICLFSNSGA
jgi:hypothetical protein